MQFTMHRPRGALALFIDHLWCSWSPPRISVDGTQFPAGGVDLLFCLGPHQGLVDVESGHIEWWNTSWVSGERKHALHLRAPEGSHILGVHFRPGGAYPFFDLPLAELADRVVPLDVLWPGGEAIRHRLAAATPATRFQVLEHELERRLAANRMASGTAAVHTVARLETWGPGGSIRALASDLGMSQRQLLRIFTDRVGLGPKGIHRVLRFQRLIRMLEPGGRPSWSRLAVGCGYFDQAHLIRDFRTFTGITPTQYTALRSPDPNFAVAE
jgi:AraC-like DNA-binding protein